MKTYVFQAELEQDEEDGRWSARVKSLPGCGVWGYTREEALQALQPAAKMFHLGHARGWGRIANRGRVSNRSTSGDPSPGYSEKASQHFSGGTS